MQCHTSSLMTHRYNFSESPDNERLCVLNACRSALRHAFHCPARASALGQAALRSALRHAFHGPARASALGQAALR
jgi:hypothetical protein